MPTFIAEVQLTLSVVGSYETIDLSSYIPSDANTVFLKFRNGTEWTHEIHGRANDSSDVWPYGSGHMLKDNGLFFRAVKVDTGRRIAIKRSISTGKVYLFGYLKNDEILSFTNLPGFTLGSAGVWSTVDLSPYITGGSGKMYGVLLIPNLNGNSYSSAELYGTRAVGSSI